MIVVGKQLITKYTVCIKQTNAGCHIYGEILGMGILEIQSNEK